MESFSEYQDLLVKKSLKGAIEWSGFGMTFISGIACSLCAGMYQVQTGDDALGWDKAFTAAKYAIPSFLAIMFLYFLVWFLIISPFLIWKEQKSTISKLDPDTPVLPVSIVQGQTYISGFVDENGLSTTKTGIRISSDFNSNTEVDVEIRHASISGSNNATLRHYISPDKFVISSVNEQAVCILEAQTKTDLSADKARVVRTFIRSFRSGLAPKYFDDLVISNHVHELNFILSCAGYRPTSTKIYVRKNGRVSFTKPDEWPEYDVEFPEW